MISVLVADDQAIVRDGLATVLDLEHDLHVVARAGGGREAVALSAELHPDVVLMDLRMPDLDGAAATRQVLALAPPPAVLVLTTYADDTSIAEALDAGARGYLTKDCSRPELLAAVRAVAGGQAVFSPQVGAALVGAFTATARRTAPAGPPADRFAHLDARLTVREAEVLALVAAGLSNGEIAGRLVVGVSTVKTHVNSIFAKLHVTTRAQAIAAARSR